MAEYSDFGVIIDQPAGSAAAVESAPLRMQGKSGFAYQADWGAVTATIVLQFRVNAAMQWRDVGDITLKQPSGSADGDVVVVDNARAGQYRVKTTSVSGAGLFKVAVLAKE